MDTAALWRGLTVFQTRTGCSVMASAACPATAFLCYLAWLLPKMNSPQWSNADLSPLSLVDGERYDFIVVGGGSAGSVVASR